jgi:hypothetical protein
MSITAVLSSVSARSFSNTGHDVSVTAIKDLKEYLAFLKERGVYTIARIAVFKDQKLPRLKPEWAIKSSPPIPQPKEKEFKRPFQSDIWVDRNGMAWADPYNTHVWKYNISIAKRAAELGFQGVQFDYIRFSSDGLTDRCRYSKPHSRATAPKALAEFLEMAHKELNPMGVELSIDVFGLVGSYDNDLGIGQKLSELLPHVDVISPMMYPSHYGAGEYGLKSPNAAPFDTLHYSVRDTLKMMRAHKTKATLRPYLQDFSLGVHYSAKHVRDQIEAANQLGVGEWLLWNPKCVYTRDAFETDPNNKP